MSSTSRRSFILAAALLACGITKASDKDEARAVVDKARIALGDVLRTKEYDSLRAGLKQAKGILIFPSVLKAGFFLGGSGGTGVLLVRGQNNEWSHPAFYTVGAVSFGVQFGGQESATVLLINHQKAVDGLMANSVKLGGDATVAVGPGTYPASQQHFAYRAVTFYGRPFQAVQLSCWFITRRPCGLAGPTTPPCKDAGLGSSAFARRY